jgi:hypothetical protein
MSVPVAPLAFDQDGDYRMVAFADEWEIGTRNSGSNFSPHGLPSRSQNMKNCPEPVPYTGNGARYMMNPVRWVRLDPPEPIETDRGTPSNVERGGGAKTTSGVRSETIRATIDRIAAEKLRPPSDILRDIARKSTPPQEWWDEDFEGL